MREYKEAAGKSPYERQIIHVCREFCICPVRAAFVDILKSRKAHAMMIRAEEWHSGRTTQEDGNVPGRGLIRMGHP